MLLSTLTVISSARLNAPTNTGVPPPSWALLTQFCNTFIPEQARLASERMTLLAKGIIRLAASINNVYLYQSLQSFSNLFAGQTIYPTFADHCSPFSAHAIDFDRDSSTTGLYCSPNKSYSSRTPCIPHQISTRQHFAHFLPRKCRTLFRRSLHQSLSGPHIQR